MKVIYEKPANGALLILLHGADPEADENALAAAFFHATTPGLIDAAKFLGLVITPRDVRDAYGPDAALDLDRLRHVAWLLNNQPSRLPLMLVPD